MESVGLTQIGVRSATERLSLSPSSVARTPIGSPCGDLSPKGEVRVYPVSLERRGSVGPLYTPTVVGSPMTEDFEPSVPHCKEPESIFSSWDVTTLNESLHVLAVLPTLAPYRPMLAVAIAPRGVWC